MKPACLLLLLWTLTAFVSGETVNKDDIQVALVSDGVKLTCSGGTFDNEGNETITLKYDDNMWEYTCKDETILVKFRTCDNCIELDVASIVGISIGDLVATAAIAVAVYLIASQAGRSSPTISPKKSSDRQLLVQNDTRPTNEHYQPLRPKGQKDTYDTIMNRK